MNFKLAEEYYLKAYEIRKKNNKQEDLLFSEMQSDVAEYGDSIICLMSTNIL